jgi:membrane fusion protein (multidrug efflux system)
VASATYEKGLRIMISIHGRLQRYVREYPLAQRYFLKLELSGFALLVIIFTLLTPSGCGKSNSANPPKAGGQAASNVEQEKNAFSQPPIPIATGEAKIGSISSYYTATATLEAEKEAEILARVTGVIKSLHCEEGDLVRAGDQVLRIDNEEYSLLLAQSEATAASFRDKYKRLKDMWKQKLVSTEEFQTVENDLKSAEAAENLARLNLSYTGVTAPFTGYVVSRLVDVGQTVNVGTPLFVIADFNPLLARVHVPSKEFRKIKSDQPVELILDSNKVHLEGKIKLVSPVIDPSSGTIKVTIEIPEYPPDTRPGDFAQVQIVTEKRDRTVLVSKIAVFTDRGERVVYVAAGNLAERRVVDVGFEDEENAEILSGVAAGEQVVIKGQRSLKQGAPIKIMNAGGVEERSVGQAGS